MNNASLFKFLLCHNDSLSGRADLISRGPVIVPAVSAAQPRKLHCHWHCQHVVQVHSVPATSSCPDHGQAFPVELS